MNQWFFETWTGIARIIALVVMLIIFAIQNLGGWCIFSAILLVIELATQWTIHTKE